MIRVFLKPALALSLVFAALVSMIRLQPYNGNTLRALITPPDGCAAPCWEGIRPGITTVGEALAILQAHPWITGITVSGMSASAIQYGSISWQWNGAQPFPADRTDGGYLGVVRNVIRSITLQTEMRFGDIWLQLDNPEQGAFFYLSSQATPSVYMVNYRSANLTILTWVNCRDFWAWGNMIAIGAANDSASGGYNLLRAREASCQPQHISFSS